MKQAAIKQTVVNVSVIVLLGLLAACQSTPANAPQTTSPGTSNQVLTLPEAQFFVADLRGESETPPVASEAHGYGVFQLNQAGDSLSMRVYVAGLSGPVTGAHLHLAPAGKSGEVIKPLQVAGDVLTGTWKRNDAEQALSDERLSQLRKGEIYLNVHTEKHAGGELRGQLLASAETVYPVYLSGADEVPPVSTSAKGVAWARLSADRKLLSLSGWTYELSGPATAAHLHRGAKGSSGDVLKPVVIEGNRLSLSWKSDDSTAPLTPGVLDLLSAGELYLNVHTAAHPNGEVRGQLQ